MTLFWCFVFLVPQSPDTSVWGSQLHGLITICLTELQKPWRRGKRRPKCNHYNHPTWKWVGPVLFTARLYLMFPTSGYSLYLRPCDVSAGATAPRLLDTPCCNLSHGLNVKTQWRFHWKWHLLLKCAGGRWNINFIKYVYSGLCTWSILIMWHIAHSTHECSWGSCATEGKTDSFSCLSRSLHVPLNSTTSSIREVCLHNLSCGVFICILWS